ncbi:MAG: S8 family peptidase [Candidatus Kapabacteria bacterium]|nr:S8 family peptidase [Ignavibacteriota bacterium]MCW5883663.1 S8 family peptidase [Candidatus Kapabacteria bacterium]
MFVFIRFIALFVFFTICSETLVYSQKNENKSSEKERLSKDNLLVMKNQSDIGSEEILQKSSALPNKSQQSKNTSNVVKDTNCFDNQIYVKFLYHNIIPHIINESNLHLYAISFGNPELDILIPKYRIIRIEEAFKVNSKKHSEYLNSADRTNNSNLKNIFRIVFEPSQNIDDIIQEFSMFDFVEYAEPVPIDRVFAVPNDTRYNDQFYLGKISAAAAWDIHKGENGLTTVLIGICDSGTDWTHNDLVENLYQNLGEDADGDGLTIEYIGGQWVLDPGDLNDIDDDGNGYVDDLIGWNFVTDDGTAANNPKAVIPNKHGTHVAGIAAAKTNNSTGIASISWNVKYLPTKNGNNSGSTSIINGYSGIIYLAEMGADIINCSWGGYSYSKANQEVIDYVKSLGSYLVISAGNNSNNTRTYPADYKGVLSVGSVAQSDAKAYYSSYGAWVDVAAPGGDWFGDARILSTVPNNGYEVMQGTSMASPLVAGLLGLMKSYNYDYTNDELTEILLANSDDISSPLGNYNNLMGFGRINAEKSLEFPNAKMTNKLKILPAGFEFIPNKDNYAPDENISIVVHADNFNPLYGSSNVSFELTQQENILNILSGSGNCTFTGDSRIKLDTLKVKVKNNINKAFAKANLALTFTTDVGIIGDSTFNFEINIVDPDKVPKVFAYNAFSQDSDPISPLSFIINDATNLNFLTADRSPVFARGGTWFEGKWYCIEDDGTGSLKLVTYDTTNGQRTIVMNFDIPVNGLAYDPETNLIWAVGGLNGQSFYTVNPKSGSVKLVQEFDYGMLLINLACDKDGNLFMIDIEDDNILQYDKWEGDFPFWKDLNADYNFAQSMEYDLDNEMLYLSSYFYDSESNLNSEISYFDFDNSSVMKLSDVKNNNEITALAVPHNYKPNKIDLVQPEFATIMQSNIVLKWNQFQNAEGYKLHFADNYDFIDEDIINLNDTMYVFDETPVLGKYYWYVEANLPGGANEFSGKWMFEIADIYCAPFTDECDEYIGKFEFNTISNTSGCGLLNGHSDYKHIQTTVVRGAEYQIKVTNPVQYNGDKVGVWIDYNQNEEFDTEELIILNSTDGNKTFLKNITIPNDAELGKTRLRARIVYNIDLDPCDYSDYGESEDYSVIITDIPAVITTIATNVRSTSAKTGGEVTSEGGLEVTSKGVCWSDNPNPDITDNKTIDGTGGGVFVSNITGLTEGTKYYYRAYATNSLGTSYGTEYELTTGTGDEQIITLNSGWNLISSFIAPDDSSIPAIWNDVKDNIVLVKNNAGKTYLPLFDVDNIVNWHNYEGYQVYTSQSVELVIAGTEVVPEDHNIALGSGWKIVSYLRNNPLNIVDAMATLTDDDALVIAKNNSGGTYLPMFGINNIGNMQPGQGYQIYLSKNSILTYPQNSLGKRALMDESLIKHPKILIPAISNTGNNSTLVIFADVPDGNEIGVYSEFDLLLGSGIFLDGKAIVTIWGNNSQSPGSDGAKANNELRIKHYDNKTGRLNDVELFEMTDIISGESQSWLNYKTDAVIIAKANIETMNDDLSIIVRPNPFSDVLTMEFSLKTESKVVICVYDNRGAKVSTLYEGFLQSGLKKISLDGSNLAIGDYTVIIDIENQRFIRKIIRMK